MSNNNSLQPFTFDSNKVRVLEKDGVTWWVAADVCKILGFVNPSDALSNHVDDDDKGYIDPNAREATPPIAPRYTPGYMAIVNESGLYALIVGSKKLEAKRFKRWVTAEVLPTIRKTGSYSVISANKDELNLDWMRATLNTLEGQKDKIAEHETRLDRVEARQNAQDQLNAYFTVFGYANYKGLHVDKVSASTLGRRAAKYCRAHSIHIQEVKDAVHGKIGSYPEDVLAEIFSTRFEQKTLWD